MLFRSLECISIVLHGIGQYRLREFFHNRIAIGVLRCLLLKQDEEAISNEMIGAAPQQQRGNEIQHTGQFKGAEKLAADLQRQAQRIIISNQLMRRPTGDKNKVAF